MNANDPDKILKYGRVEEERRFLLNTLPPGLDLNSFVRITDYYIEGTRLRLRRIESLGGKVLVFKLGQKYRSVDQETHQTIMTNIYLEESEYEIFTRLPHLTLIKQRFSYLYRGFDYSIDRFEGHLAGLLLAEIESQGKIDLAKLPLPDFAIKDVTDNPFFTGRHLAGISEAEFQHWLTSR